MKVVAPHLDIDECREGSEHEFVLALHGRAAQAGWYADSWNVRDWIVLTVSPSDEEHRCILRTLRIDFDGSTVLFGPDETHQLATDLDPSRPDVCRLELSSPSAMANAAADWLEAEIARPIVRREWQLKGRTHRVWAFEDTGRPVVSTYSPSVGPYDLGEPTRVTLVSGRRPPRAG